MTTFTTNQYNVSEKLLLSSFNGGIDNVTELNLWNINISPSGHGHYSIEAIFNIDGKELKIKTKTSNMQLIDAWKSGMQDFYEDGEDGFDNWKEVVDTMLSVIDAEDEIVECINE